MIRWHSCDNVMIKIFVRIDDWNGIENSHPTKLIFLELIIVSLKISSSQEFNTKTRSDAEHVLKKFTFFATVLMACFLILKFTFFL